jgi:hypothetical protein
MGGIIYICWEHTVIRKVASVVLNKNKIIKKYLVSGQATVIPWLILGLI